MVSITASQDLPSQHFDYDDGQSSLKDCYSSIPRFIIVSKFAATENSIQAAFNTFSHCFFGLYHCEKSTFQWRLLRKISSKWGTNTWLNHNRFEFNRDRKLCPSFYRSTHRLWMDRLSTQFRYIDFALAFNYDLIDASINSKFPRNESQKENRAASRLNRAWNRSACLVLFLCDISP